MPKGLIFFCCACCILVLTIVNLSIGPIVSGRVGGSWGYLPCAYYKDYHKETKKTTSGDALKYGAKWNMDECTRKKGMHDMEYTAFIFDIVIGFSCGLLGLLHLFDLKKDFAEKTGLIGLICGCIGFILTFIYVIFNGLVYTTYGTELIGDNGPYKRNGDYAYAEKSGNEFKCLYFDNENNFHSIYATYSDLIKKQYNYNKDWEKKTETGCVNSIYVRACATRKNIPVDNSLSHCNKLYVSGGIDTITNKDMSDRFLTALILSLLVCLGNIGLGIFGFLIAKSGEF